MGVLGRPCKERDDACVPRNTNFLASPWETRKLLVVLLKKYCITYLKSLSCIYYYTFPFFIYFKISFIICLILMFGVNVVLCRMNNVLLTSSNFERNIMALPIDYVCALYVISMSKISIFLPYQEETLMYV